MQLAGKQNCFTELFLLTIAARCNAARVLIYILVLIIEEVLTVYIFRIPTNYVVISS